MNPEIADKLYFSIGEAGRIAGVEPHVLRYWESEFGCLRPRKDSAGRRNYRKKDLEIILQIKDLLYRQRYSIAGAKRRMKDKEQIIPGGKGKDLTSALREVRKGLQAVLDILSE